MTTRLSNADRIRLRLTGAASECAIRLLFDHRTAIRNTGRANPDVLKDRIEQAREELPILIFNHTSEESWRGDVMNRINKMAEHLIRPWRGDIDAT